MFSQNATKSPLAEKRIIYSSIKRGILGRRCYSESTFMKKRKDERPVSSHSHMNGSVIVERTNIPSVQVN